MADDPLRRFQVDHNAWNHVAIGVEPDIDGREARPPIDEPNVGQMSPNGKIRAPTPKAPPSLKRSHRRGNHGVRSVLDRPDTASDQSPLSRQISF